MREFGQHLAQDLALPALSKGYTDLVSSLRADMQLAILAKTEGIDALLRSNTPIIAELKKGNKELVTGAEKIAEKAMADAVREKFPGHAIVGEEHGFQPGNDARWVFDPVDGTSAMIRTAMSEAFGLPLPEPIPSFGITIALVEGDKAVLGIVAQLKPEKGGLVISNIYVGDGSEATCNGRKITLPSCPASLAGAQLSCTVPEIMFGANSDKWAGFQGLLDATGRPCLTDQNCIGFMRLFTDVNVAYEADLAYHDAAALIPILLGAGAKVTDSTGADLLFPESAIGSEFSVLAAQEGLHAQALSAIRLGVTPENNRYINRGAVHQGYATKFTCPL